MGPPAISVKLFNPGYLVEDKTFLGYITYWFMNLGLTMILAPIGFFLAEKDQKKIVLPFLFLFFLGNLFQFSPEVAANHKFFNLSLIGLNFFTSLLLIKLWNFKILGKLLVFVLTIVLTLTGIIDFFPIVNDFYITLADLPQNSVATFIEKNTPKDAVFLNSSFLYHPASLAGRKVFLGWPYFPWSAGYDTDERGAQLDAMYSSNNKALICKLLIQNGIDYITIQDTKNDKDFPKINLSFFQENFKSIYKDKTNNFQIFDTYNSCR